MAITKANTSNVRQQQADYLRLQDLFALCIGKWKWFVLSLIVFTGLAVAYLLITPSVYTRSTSLISKINPREYPLIKFKGHSFFFFVDKIH